MPTGGSRWHHGSAWCVYGRRQSQGEFRGISGLDGHAPRQYQARARFVEDGCGGGTAGRHDEARRGQDREHPHQGAQGSVTKQIVLVDGSNVAHSTEGEKAQLANIVAMREKMQEEGFDPVVVVDAALRHQIDDTAGYERLVESGVVRQAPAGTDADYFILTFARELDARIVSNDRFRDRIDAFPDAADRLIRYMIV